MKNIISYIAFTCAGIFGFTGCDSLDLEPISSVTDANYWKSEDHFTAFNNGVYAMFRQTSANYWILGECRADIYGDAPYGGEASQGMERLPYNTLSAVNPGVSNYGDFYNVINQLNLLITKTNETDLLSDAVKNRLLGEAYGMRAYLYFHLLRSWGDVILYVDYTSGTTLDLSHLQKAVSPASDVMAQIKADITASEQAYGSNYAFTNGKVYWSLAATKMLKGEVYLWSGSQMGGGSGDYNTAKAALQEVKDHAGVSLINDFLSVFAYNNKENDEIIFAIHNGQDEYNMWNGSYRSNLVPQKAYSDMFYTKDRVLFRDSEYGDLNGLIRLGMRGALYEKAFREGDSRLATIVPVYSMKEEDGVSTYTYVGCFAQKFRGVLLDGGSERSWLDDYPIYRFSDCLLLLAQAKAMLGEDPTDEINAVRERAYGTEYFNANRATLAYPNDNDAAFYADNAFEDPDSAGALEAVLKERFREFMFEGRRWYDLRVCGWEYVHAHSSAEQERLLWPIDQNTLTNNGDLKQTPGY